MTSFNRMIRSVDLKRAKVAKVNKQLKEAKAELTERENELIAALREEKMTSTGKTESGSGYTLTENRVTSITDWPKFINYVIRNKATDLLQRRISSVAWRDRTEDGARVPGIDVFHKWGLRKM